MLVRVTSRRRHIGAFEAYWFSMNELSIHTDGASRGNPGPAAVAYIIDGLESGKVEFAQTIGQTTNNQAEYQALVQALTKLSQFSPSGYSINCIADSELMVKQLKGEYRVKDNLLRPHYQAIMTIVRDLEKAGNAVTFTAVRRSDNKRADELGNMALDGQL